MAGLSPTVEANLNKEQQFVVHAEPEGETGHYTATLTFPEQGDWQWSIQAFTMDQKMPVLSVAAPVVAEANPPAVTAEPVSPSISPMILTSAAILALGLAGVVISVRRRSRLTMALTALCLVAGVALLFAGVGTATEVEAQAKSEPEAVKVASESSLSQVQYGRQLFIAKGCITCHVNTKAAGQSEYWTVEVGATNLSNFSASPEVLYIRLKDPSAAKSNTQMPDLGLKKEEIEALIAFINSK